MTDSEYVLAEKDRSTFTYLKLWCCSLFGVAFFLTPIQYNDGITIVLGIITAKITAVLGNNMGVFTTLCFVVAALTAVIYNFAPRAFVQRLPMAKQLTFNHWIWTWLTLFGAIFAVLTYFQVGPDWLISKQTGVTAYIDVAGAIFLLIGLGCLFLPFLTDYGLLEFIGTLLQKPFQKIFNLPGRAAIDTLASWVGASSIAVVMTNAQYERGYYSAKESAVIATNFSVVSIPFVILTASVAGLPHYFLQLYATMCGICVICALITPRLPPLSRVRHEYFPKAGKQLNEDVDLGGSRWQSAAVRAVAVAEKAPSPMLSLKKGFRSLLDIYLMMMPSAMTIEFLTLVVYHNSEIFHILGYPLRFILDLLHIPESHAASPGLFLGILDQFVPTIIAADIQNMKTKFVLAGLSLTQLIFFAETAILILRSSIPLRIRDLVVIFIVRTTISLPILVLVAHVLF